MGHEQGGSGLAISNRRTTPVGTGARWRPSLLRGYESVAIDGCRVVVGELDLDLRDDLGTTLALGFQPIGECLDASEQGIGILLPTNRLAHVGKRVPDCRGDGFQLANRFGLAERIDGHAVAGNQNLARLVDLDGTALKRKCEHQTLSILRQILAPLRVRV